MAGMDSNRLFSKSEAYVEQIPFVSSCLAWDYMLELQVLRTLQMPVKTGRTVNPGSG